MGYFSDVYFITTKEGFDFLKEKEEIKELLFCADSIKYNKECDYIFVQWKSFKWYADDFDSPECFFMLALPVLEKKEIPYRFVRLGEEFGDLETRSYKAYETNFPDIYPVQRIEIYPEDWDGEQIEI